MIKERIIQLVELKGIRKEIFYQKIGMTSASFRGKAKETPINSNAIENILSEIPDANLEWLLTGKGFMLKGGNEVILHNENRKTKDKIYSDQEVPLYDIDVAAGLKDILDNTKAQKILDMIRIPGLPKCDGALPATGDSMYPLLKAGDLVCFKRASFDSIFWGEMYILDLQIDDWDNLLTVKFIQKSDKGEDYIKLVSQNQHHQAKDVKKEQIRAIAMVKATIRINSMI